jgi:MFS family permease
MRVVPQDRVSTAFSVQIALLAVSAFAGSLVGGLLPQQVAALIGTTLSDPAAYRYPLLLAAFVLIPGVWAIAVARPIAVSNATADTPVPPTDVPAVSPRAITRLLGLIALVRLLQVSGLAITNTFFNVYLDSALAVPTVQIGMLSAAGRLLAAPAALLAPLLGRRLGNHTTVIVACTGTALCMLPLALVPHWGAAGFGFIGVSALSAVRYASSLVYFLDQVPPNRRSTVMGVTEMAAGFSFAGLTLGGGYLAVTAGYQALFLLGAGITMLGVGVFIVAFPARKAL